MSGPIFLGIKSQNPVVGITSPNPGTANAMAAAQQMAQAQQQSQPIHQDSRWNQGQGTVVHEIPWHKAHPNLKNIK